MGGFGRGFRKEEGNESDLKKVIDSIKTKEGFIARTSGKVSEFFCYSFKWNHMVSKRFI